MALLVVAFAAATDHAKLLQCMLVVKSYLVGVRVQALVVGILSGITFRQYRWPLRRSWRRLGNAVIGDKENTAWALQGAVAIGLIAVGLFAVRPDFLLYLRSFKFGTVEATFGDQGPLPLRDARLNLREFRERIAVKQYERFRRDFISEDSPRGLARKELTSRQIAELQEETGEIAVLIFEQYVNPMLSSILCLARVHALNAAIHDSNVSAYSSAWQDFLLQIHRDRQPLTADKLNSFLTTLPNLSLSFIQRARDINPKCGCGPVTSLPPLSPVLTNEAANTQIFSHYEKAIAILEKQGRNTSAVRSLMIFEPYLAGAAADLISLISGEREKTDFLVNIVDDFPLYDDYITPGVINLYYQATDSWLNTIGSLPLDLVRSQIEYATHGADVMIARSAAKLNEIERSKSNKQQTAQDSKKKADEKAGTEVAKETEEKARKYAENMETIYGIFLRNSFATLTAEVDMYIQRALTGEGVAEGHRQSWIKAASRLQAMLQTRLNLPVAPIDGLFPMELDDRMKQSLRSDEGIDLESDKKIDPDFLLQADLAIALTAVLLPESSRVSAQNCTAALFYINEATSMLPPTIQANELDKAQERRLQQLIGAVANRIGDSCNWTDRRAEAKSQQPPNKEGAK